MKHLITSYLSGFLLAFLGGLSATGCSMKGCDGSAPPGLVVVVRGGAEPEMSGPGGAAGAPADTERQCAATVEYSERSGKNHREVHGCRASGENCRCDLGHQLGSFTITVRLDGETQTKSVPTTKRDDCKIETMYVCFFGECPE